MHQLTEADGVRVLGRGRTCACVTVCVDEERLRRLYMKYPRISWAIGCWHMLNMELGKFFLDDDILHCLL